MSATYTLARRTVHRPLRTPYISTQISTLPTRPLATFKRNMAQIGSQATTSQEGHGTKTVFTLNTGDKMPGIGLGTWQSKPNEVREAVKNALQMGYRHIDTALAYGNEAEVGDGIKASGVPRNEIWLTTKLDNPWHKRVPQGIESSLKDLKTDYVDLYLMHWPSSTDPDDLKKSYPDWSFTDTW